MTAQTTAVARHARREDAAAIDELRRPTVGRSRLRRSAAQLAQEFLQGGYLDTPQECANMLTCFNVFH
jgi:hypothetical protein